MSRGASAIPIFARSLSIGFLATFLPNLNALPKKLLKPLPHCRLRLPFGAALCLYCFLGKFMFGGNSAQVALGTFDRLAKSPFFNYGVV